MFILRSGLAIPSAACGENEVMEIRSRGASASELCQATLKNAPRNEGRRSADRRIHPLAAPHIQALPPERASGAAATPAGAARLSALHRGSCPGSRTPGLGPGRASRDRPTSTRALPAPSIALKRSTSRAGRYAGGDDARTARERGYEPRPQEPHSLRFGDRLEKRPFIDSVSEMGTL